MANEVPLVQMESIVKSFPGNLALDHVNFDLRSGEVHCLVGANGAGKSTLMKILLGACRKDSGSILVDGKEVELRSPRDARRLKMAAIYQELELIPCLSVAENICLGDRRFNSRWGQVAWREVFVHAEKMMDFLGVKVDPRTIVRDLGIAGQQLTMIAKALTAKSRVLVMDEPSAVLAGKDLERLFDIIRDLKASGLGIIYISHRIEEIFTVGDRVTILRDGRNVSTSPVAEMTPEEIIRGMVGGEGGAEVGRARGTTARPTVMLSVRRLNKRGVIENIGFDLRKGEVLGLAGLVGAGRTEVARALVGDLPIDGGDIYVEGKKAKIISPLRALKLGIGLLPEDRRQDGLIPCRTTAENICITVLHRMMRWWGLDSSLIHDTVARFVSELKIKASSGQQSVLTLSGGNQQKVVLAKWLAAKCKILILDEPTRGIDVGAKREIYDLIDKLAREGLSIILISSELPELIALSDRIVVMAEGRITAEFSSQGVTEERILEFALPGRNGG